LSATGSPGALVMGIDLKRLIRDVEGSFASDGAESIRIELDFEGA
jgi:hypothetical protein